jgi:AraC family transcriptional regulator, transcriptional activator FtrA
MRHVLATVVPDGAHPFEFAVACEVFGLERPELGVAWYDFRLCTADARVNLQGGAQLRGTHGLEGLAHADTIVVPNGPVEGAADVRIVQAVARAAARGARLVSFCSGAFVLAEAGVLDGRRATTHWMYADAFRARFPRVRLDPNVLFVDEGRVLTSAGTAAGIDLALHVVRLDHGAEVARQVARRMVVPPHREGGQAQFVDPPHLPRDCAGDALPGLLDWLHGHLHGEVTVAAMARRVAMSERTFARRFKEQTGTTPFRWLLHQRLQRAQALLEDSDLAVEQVAARCGFGTATNLREHFRRELGTTPTAYRRTFRGAAAPAGVPHVA